MKSSTFSDEQLVAYLDGQADHAPVAEIDAALRTDKALAVRLDGLRIDTDHLHAAFQSALDPAKKPPLFLRAANQNQWVKHAIAASLIGLVIGFGAGRIGTAPAADGWKDYVAAYHYLYTTGTIDTVENPPAVQQAELDRVGTAIGKQLSATTLRDLPGVDYKRAQILGFKDQPLLQLTFLTETGEPIALCILRATGTDQQPVQMTHLEGMSAASWQAGGFDYLLIGGQDDALLEQVATTFQATAI
ncbi:MAG: hypothetical protein WA921_07475 [Ahrensia sp.]